MWSIHFSEIHARVTNYRLRDCLKLIKIHLYEITTPMKVGLAQQDFNILVVFRFGLRWHCTGTLCQLRLYQTGLDSRS
jgi:hypothetical protein